MASFASSIPSRSKSGSTDVNSTDVNRQTWRVRAALYATEEGTTVIENIRRFMILLAGVTGLLVLAPATAQAYVVANHAEPHRRSG